MHSESKKYKYRLEVEKILRAQNALSEIVDGRCLQKEFKKIFLYNKVYFPNFANRYILNPVLTILLWLLFLT